MANRDDLGGGGSTATLPDTSDSLPVHVIHGISAATTYTDHLNDR